MQGVGVPLLRALQLRPLRGADQEEGVDQEEGEVLEVGVVPPLGEQVGPLKHKRGVLKESSILCCPAGPRPPLGRAPAPTP